MGEKWGLVRRMLQEHYVFSHKTSEKIQLTQADEGGLWPAMEPTSLRTSDIAIFWIYCRKLLTTLKQVSSWYSLGGAGELGIPPCSHLPCFSLWLKR